MDPGILLSLKHMSPAAERVTKGMDAGGDEGSKRHGVMYHVLRIAQLLFTDLNVAEAERFEDFTLRFPHAGFFLRLGVVVTEQM